MQTMMSIQLSTEMLDQLEARVRRGTPGADDYFYNRSQVVRAALEAYLRPAPEDAPAAPAPAPAIRQRTRATA